VETGPGASKKGKKTKHIIVIIMHSKEQKNPKLFFQRVVGKITFLMNLMKTKRSPQDS